METEKTDTIKLFDYGKSFVATTNCTDNTPRFLIESRCKIITEHNSVDYCLGAKCKGENTFDYEKLFQINSFEFYPLFSENETTIFRRWGYYKPDELSEYKSIYDGNALWGDKKFVIKEVKPRELLDTSEKIISATLECTPMMGRVEFERYGMKAIIDFPIKTMNAKPENWQVDTGPIPFPMIGDHTLSFELGFIAFNSFRFVDVIVDGLIEIKEAQPNLHVVAGEKILTINDAKIYLYSV